MMMKNTRLPSLKSKLLNIVLIPTIVVMLMLLGVVVFGGIMIRNAMIERQRLIVDGLARQGTQYVEETGKLIRSLAETMIHFPLEYRQTFLNQFGKNYPRFTTLYMVDSAGTIVVEQSAPVTVLGFDMSEERFFREGRDVDALYFSEPFISVFTNTITVTMAVPILVNEQFQGMLVGELNLEMLQNIIEQAEREGKTSRSFIVDQQGKLVAHPEPSWVQEQRNVGNIPVVQRGLAGEDAFTIFYDRELKTWLFGSVTPMAWGWVVVTTQPVSVAARPLILLVLISLAAYGVSILVFLWEQVRNLRQIIEPISWLTQEADRLAHEEYDEIPRETRETFAEITSLSQSFARMATAVIERTAALVITNEALKTELQERQRIEEALRVSEEKFRSIYIQSPVGIELYDSEGYLEGANPACLDIFGVRDVRDVQGFKLFEDPNLSEETKQKIRTGEAVQYEAAFDFELVKQLALYETTKSGQRYFTISITPWGASHGSRRGFLVHVLDITNRKRAEDDIRTLNKELEQRVQQRTAKLEAVNQELNEFARTVSHDLKAPLRGIKQLSQWLIQDYAETFDEQGKDMISLLSGRVERMEQLINGILNYSRIGRMEGVLEELNLNQLIDDIIDAIAPPKQIHITVDNEFPVIKGDGTRITQVFQNLLSNAVKFMDKSEGLIRLACEDSGTFWRLSITDNGPGIEPKYHDKIFHIFQTLESRDTDENTGIGLALVKKIIDLYGGKIWVESEIGKGSTFYFTYPKRLQQAC
jgi:two-component system sensor kinase FixL